MYNEIKYLKCSPSIRAFSTLKRKDEEFYLKLVSVVLLQISKGVQEEKSGLLTHTRPI